MALAKTSTGIVSIRGRLGGVYFKTGGDGQHVQAMPRVWNYTRSAAQQGAWGEGSPFGSVGIAGFSGASALWMLALLGAFSAAWLVYALAYKFYKEGKEPKHISGYNWYIHYALAFPECQRPPFWKPPHSPGELPNFLCTCHGTYFYETPPDDWPAWWPGGYYWYMMDYNGRPAYRNEDVQYFLWWDTTQWLLTLNMAVYDNKTDFIGSADGPSGYYRCDFHKEWAHVYFGSPEELKKWP